MSTDLPWRRSPLAWLFRVEGETVVVIAVMIFIGHIFVVEIKSDILFETPLLLWEYLIRYKINYLMVKLKMDE